MHEDSLLYVKRCRLSFLCLFVSSTNLGCACACGKHTGVIQECFPPSRSCQGTGGHKAGGNNRDLDEHFFLGWRGGVRLPWAPSKEKNNEASILS